MFVLKWLGFATRQGNWLKIFETFILFLGLWRKRKKNTKKTQLLVRFPVVDKIVGFYKVKILENSLTIGIYSFCAESIRWVTGDKEKTGSPQVL